MKFFCFFIKFAIKSSWLLDGNGVSVENSMIEVTRLDGSTYWINPHHIEYMENNPDLTLVMLSGKKLVLRNGAEEIRDKIIAYRRLIGAFKNEL